MSEKANLVSSKDNEERETIYTIAPINVEQSFPPDIFTGKTKQFKASFYEKFADLRSTERVFVKQASKPLIKYIESNSQFEVLDKHGQPILFAIDTTEAWTSIILDGVKPFNVMIMDDAYEELLRIDGQPGLNRFQGSVSVTHNGKLIGKIVHEDVFCSFTPTYNIIAANGSQILKIVGPHNANTTGMPRCPVFEIYLTDETTFVGRIIKQPLEFGKDDVYTTQETYILHFHPDMDVKTKTLLLATVFMLDFQFFHKAVAGGITTGCWVWFSVLFFALVIIILIGIYLIKTLHVSSSASNNTKI